MQYRRLGKTGLKVSEISLGSWLTYGTATEKEVALQTIDKAYELGINFFDTSNSYSRGGAELAVGEAVKRYPRSSYVLSTKVFRPMGEGPNDRGLSRKHIMEQSEASLKRLGVDYIDIYYCHSFDTETPVEETLRAMEDLVRQGKVLYVGVSEWSAAQIQEALHIADRFMFDKIVVNQPAYNMLNRNIEKEIMPLCARNGVGQVVYSSLGQGVLTGKYKSLSELPQDSRAADPKANKFIKKYLNEESLPKVEKLQKIADEAGLQLSHMALAWILRKSNVASALTGASRPAQVEDNVKASGIKLTEDVLQKIEEALS